MLAWPHRAYVMPAVRAVLDAAPLRHRVTPGGFTMSVAMSNCGALGWISDRRGYRYARDDPDSGLPWPAMPAAFERLAAAAAAEAGFDGFVPDACLVRSEEHTSELQSLMRLSYAVFCLKKKIESRTTTEFTHHNNI